jgi:hypothetical protein
VTGAIEFFRLKPVGAGENSGSKISVVELGLSEIGIGQICSSKAAILILRFHDIKTLAPRGVNNS